MRLKGALHVHSTLSHDGTMSIAELADWYRSRGYDFFALGEHSQDMDAERIRQMEEESAQHSDNRFLIIPGLEYSCRGGIHLFSLGSTLEILDVDPVAVANQTRRTGAFVILAHPSRMKWNFPVEVIKAVNAAELWNVGYDGKYLPPFGALSAFRRMHEVNPELLAIGGQDLHRRRGFYDLAVTVQASGLDSLAILSSMHAGDYEVTSRFFRFSPHARFSPVKVASLWFFSWQLAALRGARGLFQR
jgi:hypothetical protein